MQLNDGVIVPSEKLFSLGLHTPATQIMAVRSQIICQLSIALAAEITNVC